MTLGDFTVKNAKLEREIYIPVNAMYPRTKQQTHDKGSMVRAQYCSEWTDLGYGISRLFDSFVPR